MAKTWLKLWDVRFWCLRTPTGAIVGLSFQATCETKVEAAQESFRCTNWRNATVAWCASQQWRSWWAQPLPRLEESMQTDLIHLHAVLHGHVDTVARCRRCTANLWGMNFQLNSSRKIWKSSLDWKLERLHFVWPGLSHEPSGQQPVPAQRDFLWCRWTLNKLWVESCRFQRRWQQCSALGALWHSETWAYQGKERLGQAWQHVKVSSPCRFKVLLLPGILLGNLWPGETSYDMRSKFEPWKSTISGDNSLPSCTSCSHHIRPQPKWKGRWNQNNAHHFRTIGSKMIHQNHISTNSSPMFWRQYLVGKDLTLGLDPLSIEFPPPSSERPASECTESAVSWALHEVSHQKKRNLRTSIQSWRCQGSEFHKVHQSTTHDKCKVFSFYSRIVGADCVVKHWFRWCKTSPQSCPLLL